MQPLVLQKRLHGYKDYRPGQGRHSSEPPGNTPSARLFSFANEIEKKRPFKRKLLPEAKTMFRLMAPSFGFSKRLVYGNLWLFKPLFILLAPKSSPFIESILATTCCFTQMRGSDAANVIPNEPYILSGSTDCRHYHAVTEDALRFTPIPMTAAQKASCYAVNEIVTISALFEGVSFFKKL